MSIWSCSGPSGAVHFICDKILLDKKLLPWLVLCITPSISKCKAMFDSVRSKILCLDP
jgi:hypothetical protein